MIQKQKLFSKIILGATLLFSTTAFAATQTVNLEIKDMFCSMCAAKVETQLKKQDGVLKASIDAKAAKGTVEFDDSKISTDKIVEACQATGFKCSLAK